MNRFRGAANIILILLMWAILAHQDEPVSFSSGPSSIVKKMSVFKSPQNPLKLRPVRNGLTLHSPDTGFHTDIRLPGKASLTLPIEPQPIGLFLMPEYPVWSSATFS